MVMSVAANLVLTWLLARRSRGPADWIRNPVHLAHAALFIINLGAHWVTFENLAGKPRLLVVVSCYSSYPRPFANKGPF